MMYPPRTSWKVEKTDTGTWMEPVFPTGPDVPFTREEHYRHVYMFCLCITFVLGVIFICLLPLHGSRPFSDIAAWREYRKAGISLLVIAFFFSHIPCFIIHRLIRVLYCRPVSLYIPHTWVSRFGRSLVSLKGLALFIIIFAVPFICCYAKSSYYLSVKNGKVVGLDKAMPPKIRLATLIYLKKHPDPAVVPSLVELVQDKSESRLYNPAFNLLESILGSDSMEFLEIKMKYERTDCPFGDRDEWSFDVLKPFIVTRKSEPLVKALHNHKESEAREGFAAALGAIGDAPAVEGLISALNNESDWRVRESIIHALGNSGNVLALDCLARTYTNESNTCLRVAAIDALAKIGQNTSVIDILYTACDEYKFRTGPCAEKALRRIMPDEYYASWPPDDGLAHNIDEYCYSLFKKNRHRYAWNENEKRFYILPETSAISQK